MREPYGCLDRGRTTQRLDRILGAYFLNKSSVMLIVTMLATIAKLVTCAGCSGQTARHEENDDQRIAEACEELPPERRAFDVAFRWVHKSPIATAPLRY